MRALELLILSPDFGGIYLEQPGPAHSDFPIDSNTLFQVAHGVIVRNSSNEPVIAYVVRWTYMDWMGKVVPHTMKVSNFENPEPAEVLPPGSVRFVSMVTHSVRTPRGLRIDPSDQPHIELLKSFYSEQRSATVSLDLVIFGSGRVTGPDESNESTYLRAYIDSRNSVCSNFASGGSTSELDALVEAEIQKRTDRPSRKKSLIRLFNIEAGHAPSYIEAFQLLRAYHSGMLLERISSQGEEAARRSVQVFITRQKNPKFFRRNENE